MNDTNECLKSITMIQQKLENQYHEKISMFQAIAILLSEGLKEQEILNDEYKDYSLNYLQG